MTPDEYCQQKTARSGTSFYYSFLFLPPERRRAITALYAFCREVDDVVDEVSDPSLARTKLAWWRREIGAAFTGVAAASRSRSRLRPVVAAYRLPEEHFQTVIDGMAMDLERNRYLDFAELERYCHCVAGVVGLMSAEIFGYANPATRDYARDLGIAFQLTNIIRDVGEDARRGRIYLPQDELARHGVTATSLLKHEEQRRADRRSWPSRWRARGRWYERAIAALPRRGPAGAAARPRHGRHLPRPAGRDRARRLSRARPPDRADAAAQALDRLEDRAPCLMPRAARVAVVGGGWAGCAAAVTLAAAGIPVDAVRAGEDARRPGAPRRRSTASRSTTASTSLIGAYRQTLALLASVHRSAGAGALFHRLPLTLRPFGATPPRRHRARGVERSGAAAPRRRRARRRGVCPGASAWP